mmetsp:Transcript_18541/g.24101  ORF Transcript_18541/g.24101 Transcript_18541/m.24101 type:complete len:411 (-) Transcript_18541:1624-2856(-)
MSIDDDPLPSSIQIQVFDKDMVGEDDSLGQVEIPLDQITTTYQAKWYPLSVGQGQIYLVIKKIRDPLKAKNSSPNVGIKPGILKYLITLILALSFIACFLGSILAHALAAILEFLAAVFVRFTIRAFTGFLVKFDFISIRPGKVTEIAISGLQIQNPNGSYKSPYFLRLDRLDIHIKPSSFFQSPTRVITVPVLRVDGLTLYTEKAKSPLVSIGSRQAELLNIWGFLGASPLDENEKSEELRTKLAKIQASSAQCMQQCFQRAKIAEERGLLPKSAMGLNIKFLIDCLLITDLNLYLKDLIADLAGGTDGTGEHEYKPVEIGHILMDVDDFGAEPLWIVDLVKLILPKFITHIPVSSILTSSVSAAGSTLFDKPSKAQKALKENTDKVQDRLFGANWPLYHGTDETSSLV